MKSHRRGDKISYKKKSSSFQCTYMYRSALKWHAAINYAGTHVFNSSKNTSRISHLQDSEIINSEFPQSAFQRLERYFDNPE